ncbi:MAG: hypothetical protein KatS3mg032_2060 [Cyclobacteriaceae bacterium]|nr:MAG: hypothetical protein KatS3mg032_2060 [Cyclobacteriaceae bacterium]
MPYIRAFMFRLYIVAFVWLFACSARPKSEEISGNLFEAGKRLAQLADRSITEASGIVASRKHAGMLWVHNDSGDSARLFLVDTLGRTRMVVWLKGARNRDWEDIAAGPGPVAGKSYLYVADIGDNHARHHEKVIYRFEEPDFEEGEITLTQFDSIRLVYPDGPRDAETLLTDPDTRDLFILTKRERKLHLYRLAWPYGTGTIHTAVLEADDITFNLLGEPRGYHPLYYNQVTGGDISPDGSEILIKDYSTVYYWKRRPRQSLAEVLRTRPFLLPYRPEARGEAIAFSADGKGYYTLSEEADGIVPYLIFYARKKSVTQP